MKSAPKTSTSQASTSKTSTGKSDEIVKRAYDIFYRQGFHATGVDTLLADSGISKRTLYKYFRSKEELIAALVAHHHALLMEAFPRQVAERSTDPKEQILALFDLEGEAFESGNYTGCFAINAKLEYEGKDERIEAACSAFYERMEAFVAALCAKARCRQPKTLARQIMILFKGAMVHGQMHHDAKAPATAREMVRALLGA